MAGAADAAPAVAPRGTPITLETVRLLSTKFAARGERFDLRLASPVAVDGVVVIPAGAPAVGEVVDVVRPGAFGRSGKMGIRLVHVQARDRLVPLEGAARHAGKGETAGVVATTLLGGVVWGMFTTGRSAEFPAGSRFEATLAEDVPASP